MTRTDTNISAGCELTNLKLKMSKGKLTMENKSVIFRYLILLTIFLTVLNSGLFLFTMMSITETNNIRVNMINSSPWDRNVELSLLYSMNLEGLNAYGENLIICGRNENIDILKLLRYCSRIGGYWI